jgi:hypothetical protein
MTMLTFLNHIGISDEAVFHISGKANGHTYQIWISENPHVVREHECDSPKLKVWCAVTLDFLIEPFIFVEVTVTARTYTDMLENYAVPQIRQEYFVQEDGSTPHQANIVTSILNE